MFTVESQGAVDIVSPNAPINDEYVDELAETMAAGLTEGQPMVVINMSEAPLIDSAGLELLLDIHDSAHQRGGAVKLAAVSQLCREVLRVTGVGEHFEMYDNVKAAVGSFVR